MPAKKKKQSVLNKIAIKLSKPKGRIIATVLLFAVVGGGFMVYRSFAATTALYTGTGGYLSSTLCNGYNSTRVNEAQKNNEAVVQMGVGGCAHSLPKLSTSTGTYQTCALVKGVGKISFAYGTQNMPINSPKAYTNVCEKPHFDSYGVGGYGNAVYKGVNYAYPAKGTKIRVSVITYSRL